MPFQIHQFLLPMVCRTNVLGMKVTDQRAATRIRNDAIASLSNEQHLQPIMQVTRRDTPGGNQ